MSQSETSLSDPDSPREEDRLRVSIEYEGIRTEFSGEPEAVLRSTVEFISKQIPAIHLARRIAMSFSTNDLVEKFQDFVRLTPEGPRVSSGQLAKLSDKEVVALQLVGNKIGSETSGGSGRTTLSQLQESTALNSKSLSSRLSELVKAGHVLRETKDSEGTFRITTAGIDWLLGVLSTKKTGRADG